MNKCFDAWAWDFFLIIFILVLFQSTTHAVLKGNELGSFTEDHIGICDISSGDFVVQQNLHYVFFVWKVISFFSWQMTGNL